MMATQAGQSPWEVRFSTSRKIAYFFNHETGASEWEPPAGLSELQIRQLPGAEKYLTPIDDTMRQNAHQPGGVSARTLAARQQQQEKPKKGVRARHILAKHSQSRRPSSWRQAQITRSPDEARAIIQAHINHLSSLPNDQVEEAFKAIAKTESDCSSAKAGGDLGYFEAGAMQAAFENAAFALQPKEISGIVETDSGIHVLYRVE